MDSDKPHEVLGRLYGAVNEPSYDTLIRHVPSHRGLALSKSSLTNLLRGSTAPKMRTVRAFVAACFADAFRAARRENLSKTADNPEFWLDEYEAARRREAAASSARDESAGVAELESPGRLIADTPPADLEVRRTLPAASGDSGPLPAYIVREHDHVLRALSAAALTDAPRSAVAMLVSDSTSGKTRALFEVLRHAAPISLAESGWRVWPSLSPYPAERFLDELPHVQARTVIWLNEAQRYLIDPEQRIARDIAAGLRALLADPARGPVLVLGTLWPLYHDRITRSGPGQDRYADARALLAGHTIHVPGVFSGADLAAARASKDTRVRDAVAAADSATAGSGEATRVSLTQHMAGVPALLDLYANASTVATAVLHAAMDARRMGLREWIPVSLLHHAAPAYLDQGEQSRHLTHDHWFTDALETLTSAREAAGVRGLHRPPAIPGARSEEVVRLEDYLDQYGRTRRAELIPPIGFWNAAASYAHPGDLVRLKHRAWERGLDRPAAQIRLSAADRGSLDNAGAGEVARELAWLRTIGADEKVAALLGRSPASRISAENHFGLDELLTVLLGLGADEQVVILARRVAVTVPLDSHFNLLWALRFLRRVGSGEFVDELVNRSPAEHCKIDSAEQVRSMFRALRDAGADKQVPVLIKRVADSFRLSHSTAVAGVLETLCSEGADAEAAVLARRATARIGFYPLSNVDSWLSVDRLLGTLNRLGFDDQTAELARRVVTHVISRNNYRDVQEILRTLQGAGLHDEAGALVEWMVALATSGSRDAGRILKALSEEGAVERVTEVLSCAPALRIPLDDMRSVEQLMTTLHEEGDEEQLSILTRRVSQQLSVRNSGVASSGLWLLHRFKAREQVVVLAKRIAMDVAPSRGNPQASLFRALNGTGARESLIDLADRFAAHIPFDDVEFVIELLEECLLYQADRPIQTLLRRSPGEHASLNKTHAVTRLMELLHRLGADDQVAVLARRATERAIAEDSLDLLPSLLKSLHEVGAEEQTAELLDRSPATRIALDDPKTLTRLVTAMHEVGAGEQITALLNRSPAEHVTLDDPLQTENLLKALRKVSADAQISTLMERLPGLGMFKHFKTIGDNSTRFRYGREPDGSPTAPWTLTELLGPHQPD